MARRMSTVNFIVAIIVRTVGSIYGHRRDIVTFSFNFDVQIDKNWTLEFTGKVFKCIEKYHLFSTPWTEAPI